MSLQPLDWPLADQCQLYISTEVHLDEGLLGRLASPKAASIRRYDGRLVTAIWKW
jgi:hypothetical protein